MTENKESLPVQVEVSITDTDQIKTLIELLSKYEKDLPEELMRSVIEIAENDNFILTVEDGWVFAGTKSPDVETSLGEGFNIGAVNKILKKVEVFHDGRMYWKELDSFWCKLNGEMYVQWGDL